MSMNKEYRSPRAIALKDIRNDLYCQSDLDRDRRKAKNNQHFIKREWCQRWFLNWWDLPHSTECVELLNSREITRLNKLAINEYESGGY